MQRRHLRRVSPNKNACGTVSQKAVGVGRQRHNCYEWRAISH
ncbi:MAG: hypothetical protein ACJAVT_002023, partial [Yoonia sp.]